jgi:hypothetical protein
LNAQSTALLAVRVTLDLGQGVLTLAELNVLLAAEAHAGIQARAIVEDRMKVMRRMGDLPLVQFGAWTMSSLSWRTRCGVCATSSIGSKLSSTRSIPSATPIRY